MKALLSLLLLSSCSVGHTYFLTVQDAARLPSAPPEAMIPAVREKDGAQVSVRRAAIVEGAQLASEGRLRVRTKMYSPMITAGSLMTWIGAAVSIAGNVMFFIGLGPRDTLYTVGLAMSPAAEPVMIVGTVLWILGTRRHPELR